MVVAIYFLIVWSIGLWFDWLLAMLVIGCGLVVGWFGVASGLFSLCG